MFKIGSQTQLALTLLANRGPMDAGTFGADLWRGRKRKRVISSNGGGDYAAQCFLGRLRKLGLARTTSEDEGSSRWEITQKGRVELARAVHGKWVKDREQVAQ